MTVSAHLLPGLPSVFKSSCKTVQFFRTRFRRFSIINYCCVFRTTEIKTSLCKITLLLQFIVIIQLALFFVVYSTMTFFPLFWCCILLCFWINHDHLEIINTNRLSLIYDRGLIFIHDGIHQVPRQSPTAKKNGMQPSQKLFSPDWWMVTLRTSTP